MKKTILFVEDYLDDVDLTLEAMGQNLRGYEVVVARDGVEALEFLLGEKGKPELRPQMMILDLHLPRLDGMDVLRRLREEWGPGLKNLKIAVLSSAPVELDHAALMALGVRLHLQKPISRKETETMVEKLSGLLAAPA